MIAKRIMLIAGEASGDSLAAELILALRDTLPDGNSLEFFGAGGTKMAAAGMELLTDMTEHAAIGLGDVIKKYGHFRKVFHQLLGIAKDRRPDLIVLVDFGAFNLRFAAAIREHLQSGAPSWSPKIVQFVSPQVWASRAYRAKRIEKTVDLLLCLFPFEQSWYAKHAPKLRVEFVGHPIVDRYAGFKPTPRTENHSPVLVLLPGSRRAELKRHLPVMADAAQKISQKHRVKLQVVVPNDGLAALANELVRNRVDVEIIVGQLAESLSRATLAIASTGTVLLECAYFGVPTVALYKTSWGTYQIGKRIVQVKYLSMPNILADKVVYPEFVQDDATVENIAGAAMELLETQQLRDALKAQLAEIVASLGGPGSSRRAATAIARLFLS